MPRTVSYQILDEADGRFAVVATMEPNRIYRREGLDTLAETEAWVEGLRVLMAACGAPVVRAPGPAEPPLAAALPIETPCRKSTRPRPRHERSVGEGGTEGTSYPRQRSLSK